MSKCPMIGLYSLFLVIVTFSVADSGELSMGEITLDAELQKLKQAGIPTTIEELIPYKLPDEENAAVIYREIFKMKNSLYEKYKEEWDWIPYVGTKWWDWDKVPYEMKKRIADLLLNNDEFISLFKLLEKATSMKCQFLNREDYKNSKTILSDLSGIRSCANLLASKAKIEAENGEVEKALHTCLIGLKLAKSLNDPFAVSQLTRISINGIVAREIEKVLQKGEGNVNLYQSLIREIESERENNLTAYGLRGEIVIHLSYFSDQNKYIEKVIPKESIEQLSLPETEKEEIIKIYKDPEEFWGKQYLTYLQTASEIISLTKKPYWEVREPMKKLADKIQKLPKEEALMTQWLIPVPSPLFLRKARLDATLGNAELALALKIYKAKNGGYPDRLTQIVQDILKELPKDPFTGEDYVYHRVGYGFVIYSLGDNAKDDGGISAVEKRWQGDFDIVWKCEK